MVKEESATNRDDDIGSAPPLPPFLLDSLPMVFVLLLDLPEPLLPQPLLPQLLLGKMVLGEILGKGLLGTPLVGLVVVDEGLGWSPRLACSSGRGARSPCLARSNGRRASSPCQVRSSG